MTFPATALSITVEIYYSAAWNDITSYVYSRDSIRIRRGRTSPRNAIEPSTCTLTLNNRDGRFSPRNPVGALYGLIGRNTQLRVSIDGAIRFLGEVSEWPSKWSDGGADVWVPITASGLTRRLGQGASPLQSPLRRALDGLTAAVAYWPMEDGDASTQLASGFAGGAPMTITGSPRLAAYSDFVGSSPVPIMSAGSLRGVVPSYTSGAGQVRAIMAFTTASPPANNTVLIGATGTGTVRRWELWYETGGALSLHGFDGDDAEVCDSGAVAFAVDGLRSHIGFGVTQNGADVDWRIDKYTQDWPTSSSLTGTFAGYTVGRLTSALVTPSGSPGETAIGHLTVTSSAVSLYDTSSAFNAYNGETARARFSRLCTENGLTVGTIGSDVQKMGYQGQSTLLELLRECEQVDGMVREGRSALGYYYRSNSEITNQDPLITFDYETDLVGGLDPTEDDQLLRNDVTVSRYRGTSARVADATSALGTTAVGVYDEAVTLSLNKDDQPAQHASWRVHHGTWDEVRYPSVSISMAKQYADATTIRSIDISWPIAISNLPAWMPPGPARGLVVGYEETIAQFEWDITFYLVPSDAWDVWELEDATWGYTDTDGSALGADVTSAGTSLTVTSTGDVWTDADQPFDIIVGGETMTVTAVAGATSPQTFTITRAVNGIVKAHSTGAAVELARPVVVSL